jgi:hypothetical protein
MNVPFLGWLENCAVRFLISSPRVGFIAIKHHSFTQMYVAQDPTDPQIASIDYESEPLSMQLERLYHEPSYGELE